MRKLVLAAALSLCFISPIFGETTVLTPGDRTKIETDYKARDKVLQDQLDILKSDVDKLKAGVPIPPPVPPTTPPTTGSLTELGAIVAAMQPGTFKGVGKNLQQDVFITAASGCGWGNAGAIMNQWGGAAFDSKRNRLYFQGGGHNSYCGDEVYAFDLETLTHSLFSGRVDFVPDMEKSAAFGCATACAYKSVGEAPISYHGYDALQYLPNVDKWCVHPQASAFIGYSYDNFIYCQDPTTKAWKRGPAMPDAANTASDYWEKTGEFILATAVGVQAYHPVTGAVRVLQNNEDAATGKAGVIFQERNLFIQLGRKNPYDPGTSPFVAWDLNQANPRRLIPTVAGNTDFMSAYHPGIAIDPVSKRLVIWAGDNRVWACTIDPYLCVMFTDPNGPAALTNNFAGINGKWHYIPAVDAFIGFREANEKAWIFKLPKPGQVTGDTTTTPQETINLQNLAGAGGIISIPNGTYRQAIVLDKASTLEGNGAKLIGAVAQGKGAIVVNADSTIRNLTVTDLDGGDNLAAVRMSVYGAVSLVLDNITAQRVQTGLLTVATGGTITARNLHFLDILGGEPGKTHGVYVGCGFDYVANKYTTCTTRHDTFNSEIRRVAKEGHTFKSRSPAGTIDRTVLAQEGSDSSRSVDLSFGGAWSIVCSVIQHGNRGNDDIIAHGPEGAGEDNRTQSLMIDRSVIINDRPGAILYRHAKAPPVVKDSILVGVGLGAAVDGGGNKLFSSRAAAGLPSYPAAELAMLPAGC